MSNRVPASTGKGRKEITTPSSGALTRLPPAPAHLPDEGKKEWKRTGRHLIARGILTETDVQTLVSYCLIVSNIAAYMRGEGDKATMGTLPQLLTLQRQYSNELGLTPSARSRIQGEGGGDDDDLSGLDI